MNLINLSYNTTTGLSLSIDNNLIALSIISIIILLILKWRIFAKTYSDFEINEVKLGIGENTVTIKPNDQDLQIAYQLWVELSTRKIGLAIDKENDVIIEIYNSWYEFFKIARELIKTIPVQKVRANTSTKAIIDLAFKILNEALRLHLTQWQARFRIWYELEKLNNPQLTPQQLQKTFPDYDVLETDMLRVNQILINYKILLADLINNQ